MLGRHGVTAALRLTAGQVQVRADFVCDASAPAPARPHGMVARFLNMIVQAAQAAPPTRSLSSPGAAERPRHIVHVYDPDQKIEDSSPAALAERYGARVPDASYAYGAGLHGHTDAWKALTPSPDRHSLLVLKNYDLHPDSQSYMAADLFRRLANERKVQTGEIVLASPDIAQSDKVIAQLGRYGHWTEPLSALETDSAGRLKTSLPLAELFGAPAALPATLDLKAAQAIVPRPAPVSAPDHSPAAAFPAPAGTIAPDNHRRLFVLGQAGLTPERLTAQLGAGFADIRTVIATDYPRLLADDLRTADKQNTHALVVPTVRPAPGDTVTPANPAQRAIMAVNEMMKRELPVGPVAFIEARGGSSAVQAAQVFHRAHPGVPVQAMRESGLNLQLVQAIAPAAPQVINARTPASGADPLRKRPAAPARR